MESSVVKNKRYGSWDWCEETGGKLTTADKMKILTEGFTDQMKLFPPLIRHRLLGWHRPDEPIDLDALEVPDTPAAKEAYRLCEELSPRFMVTHCVRTYWFSRLLAIRWGFDFDDEILFVGAMLHDIGLMEDFDERKPDEHCFTIPSARAAQKIAEKAGWSKERQLAVMESITLNPNPRVKVEEGMEAHLLNAGVLIDASGMRMWELHPHTVKSLLEKEPRLEFKKCIVHYIHREADAHPGCRFHFERRWFQFHRLAAFAPFAE